MNKNFIIPFSIISFTTSSGVITAQENVTLEHPNVIFIILDDMNNYVINKQEVVKTPYLDQFRKTAITFTNASCASPLSTPSRASLFTGLYPHNSGVYANGGDPWNQSEILMYAETLPELFKRSGYTTYGRGKVFGINLQKGRLEQNFDNRPLYGGGYGPYPDKENRVISQKEIFPEFWGVQSYPDSIFPDVINTNAVIDYLNNDHDKPFFVSLGLWRPHTPFTSPQRFFDIYNENTIDIPEGYNGTDLNDVPDYKVALLDPFGRFEVTGANDPARWKKFIHGYYAACSFADWNIGRVIEAVDKSKYANNTIIVVFSDNGFHIGTKSHWEKNTLWDSSSLVPLIIRYPGAINSGKEIHSTVGLIDLFPTLVDVCQLDAPKQKLDGKSLRPLFENNNSNWDRPTITSLGEHLISVRNENYRYIEYPDGEMELYDIKKDPYEWNNIANKKNKQNIISSLKSHLPDKYVKELPGTRRN